MERKKILVTGASGQLGSELKAASSGYGGSDFVFLSRQDLPLDAPASQFQAILERARPDWCINCAAYTAVDKAETESDLARLLNGEAVGRLAEACRSFSARLIHLSTDYVFDGQSSRPLTEKDPTNPINVYGASKLLGEQLALRNNDATLILRTSWVYSSFGHNFVKTMMRLMREKESIRVVDDQVGSPTYAADLAGAILQIIHGPGPGGTDSTPFIPGIYHYSNEGEISWHEFALAIKELTGSLCQIDPVPSSGYPTPAKRPPFSLLDKTLIQKTYGIRIPLWRDSLRLCIDRLLSSSRPF